MINGRNNKKRNSISNMINFKAYRPFSPNRRDKSLTSNFKLPPKTNIEKIVEVLNEISERLQDLGEETLYQKSTWVTKELLSNNIYNFVDTEENLSFFKNYSPDVNIGDDSKFLNDSENDKGKQSSWKERSIGSTSLSVISDENIRLVKLEEIGTEFDVFSFADEVGRENMMYSICFSVFNYNGIFDLVKSTCFAGYIEELRKGYTLNKDAVYHNVSIIFNNQLGFPCM